jgi:hypothetical protein
MVERLELWRRDPVECVQELMENPAFRDHMAYAPERVYKDKEGKVRIYDEMWTANWWWDLQVKWNIKIFMKRVADVRRSRSSRRARRSPL